MLFVVQQSQRLDRLVEVAEEIFGVIVLPGDEDHLIERRKNESLRQKDLRVKGAPSVHFDQLGIGLTLLAQVTNRLVHDAPFCIIQLAANRKQHLGRFVDLVVNETPMRIEFPEPLPIHNAAMQTGTAPAGTWR